jgi:hypothetical protein
LKSTAFSEKEIAESNYVRYAANFKNRTT